MEDAAGAEGGAEGSSSSSSASAGGGGEGVFQGSDVLAARSIATKARAPNVLGLGGAAAARALGPTDIIGHLSALGAAEAAAGGGAAGLAAPAAATAAAAAAAADPFSAAAAPMARRSAQIAAPVDGEHADGRTTARLGHFLALAGQTDRVAVATGETLLQHAQLRREAAAMLSLARAVEAEEQAVFKLERLRKQGSFAPYQAEALAGGAGGGGRGGGGGGRGGAGGAARGHLGGAEGAGSGKRQLEDAEGGAAKVARRG